MKKIGTIFLAIMIIILSIITCLTANAVSNDAMTSPYLVSQSLSTVEMLIKSEIETSDIQSITNTTKIGATAPNNTGLKTEFPLVTEQFKEELTENAINTKTTTATQSTEQIINKEGFCTFSLEGSENNITIKAELNGKEYVFEFKAKDNYIIQGNYPIGIYTVTETEVDNKDIKIKQTKIDGKETKTFKIEDSDYQTVLFSVTEKNKPYILGFLKRQWFLLIALIAMIVGYRYLRKNRILPSQER